MAKANVCPILIGTSGWYYKDWIGKFYPKGIKSYADLTFFAKTFNTVENNSAFYHMPQQTTIQKWIKATPSNFTFSIKLNQSITHYHQLAVDKATKELLKVYFDSVNQLQNRLGAILIQLPARFRYNLERLDSFLQYYTKHYPVRTAIEFRNQFWFTKDTYALLKKYNIALAIAQSSRYPSAEQMTADFVYFRFHGPKQLFASSYTDKELSYWAGIIKKYRKKAKVIYVYFNNDVSMFAVKNGLTLKSLLGI
jgi:uncharacterized protein YecE (DUF72 family)